MQDRIFFGVVFRCAVIFMLGVCSIGCSKQPQLNADGQDESDPSVAIEALDADAPSKYQSK